MDRRSRWIRMGREVSGGGSEGSEGKAGKGSEIRRRNMGHDERPSEVKRR